MVAITTRSLEAGGYHHHYYSWQGQRAGQPRGLDLQGAVKVFNSTKCP